MPDATYDAVAKVVTGIVRRDGALDTRALYPATIVDTDGELATVDAQFGDKTQRLSDCRVRREAGLTNEAEAGSPCLLGWEGGDPSRRYVALGSFRGTSASWTVKTGEHVTLDTPETNAKHDLVSEHEIGQSAGTLSTTLGVNVKTAKATGDDSIFDLEVEPADNTKPMGPLLSKVTFGRAYGAAPKAVLQVNEYVTAPTAAYDVKYAASKTDISISGTFPNPTGKTVITVNVRGNK